MGDCLLVQTAPLHTIQIALTKRVLFFVFLSSDCEYESYLEK